MKKDKKHIIIYNYRLAQDLFECGYDVVSVKPNKKVHNEVVFFFKNEKGLSKYLNEVYGISI